MAVSDAILRRLLELHPKIIDLTLDRVWRLLDRLGNPQGRLPPVIHVAGTNGKGSVVAYLRAMLEAGGRTAHVYTSPHLVRFHERIRIGQPGGGELISEQRLSALLEECEAANGGEPITFFEITTVAAFLAFAREPADYLLLEVGLGGRLDATNVVAAPRATVITSIDYDHQQYLGETLTEIAGEKAGILKRDVVAVVGPQPDEALRAIETAAARVGAPLLIANQDWQAYEQQGALVYQDEAGLLDLPMPLLPGRFQIDNAGIAVATMRAVGDPAVGRSAIAEGLRGARWPARMQRLGSGRLTDLLPEGSELWLDGGHNPSAGRAVAESLADFDERVPRPLTLIVGMLKTKEAAGFIKPFAGLASRMIALAIPDEENALPAEVLKAIAEEQGIEAEIGEGIEDAVRRAAASPEARIVICGSLYLAGRVLALHQGEAGSSVSGASRR
ncbi:MAG: folylpolyglutamate synthase/dihydrofolate synthase family protein [Parvibaculaceae bacterium]